MGFGFKQPLVGEKRCVTTLITAAEETNSGVDKHSPLKHGKPTFCQQFSWYMCTGRINSTVLKLKPKGKGNYLQLCH